VASKRTTCPSHLIFIDSIIRVILAEEYRSYNCLLYYVEETKWEKSECIRCFLEPEFSY
jgi:hypothetical protein